MLENLEMIDAFFCLVFYSTVSLSQENEHINNKDIFNNNSEVFSFATISGIIQKMDEIDQ